MTRKRLFLFFIFIILIGRHSNGLHAQDVKVNTTSIEDIDNKIVIKYDIVDSKASDRFNIAIEITSSTGQNIQPNSISGDLGNKISGGSDKQIVWDYTADGFVMKGNINIEIFAVPMANAGLTKSLFLSAIYPGLGIYKLEKKKSYLLLGVAGYGCLASSVILNMKANDNYQAYLDNTDAKLSDDLLKKSQNQNNLSKTMGYATLGIWGINLIWTAVKAKQKRNMGLSIQDKQRLQFYSSYDPYTGINCINLRFRF
jgi:hypothetical protein